MIACFFDSLCLIEGCFNNAQVMCSVRDVLPYDYVRVNDLVRSVG